MMNINDVPQEQYELEQVNDEKYQQDVVQVKDLNVKIQEEDEIEDEEHIDQLEQDRKDQR